MAGTFSQIYIQVVFAVQGRENLLQKPWRNEVFKYMAGIIKGKNQKPIIINGVSNHVHLFIGLKPAYVLNQEAHHAQKTFKQEYLEFLKKFEIEYDEKYLFDWNED
jgi:REP element-mobilizing transposase RayT